jgi:hypothetical protein
MNKRQAKIEALGRIIGLLDVSMFEDSDLYSGLDDNQDGDKVRAAVDEISGDLARRMLRLERGR